MNLLGIAPDVDFAATNDLLAALEVRMLKGITLVAGLGFYVPIVLFHGGITGVYTNGI